MSLLRKAFVVNSAELLCLLFGLFQSIALSRGLGPERLGQYTVILSALTLATQLCSLGFPLSFLYHSKRDPAQKRVFLINALVLVTLTGAIGGVIVMGLIQGWPHYFGRVANWVLPLCGAYILLGLFGVLGRNCLLVDIEAKRLGLLRILSIGTSTTILVFLWRIQAPGHYFSVNAALLGCSAAVFVRWLLGSWWVRRQLDFSQRPSIAKIKEMGSMGLRLSAADLMVILLAQVNVLIIKGHMDDFSSVGYYSRGHRIAMLLIAAGQAVLPLLFSHWAGLKTDKLRDHIERVMRCASTGAFVLVLLLVILGKPLVLLFYGHDYLPAVVPLMILLPGTGLYLLGRILIHALSSRGKPQLSTTMLLVNVGICATLSWTLVPLWGIKAAALASTLGHACMFVLLLWTTRREHGIRVRCCMGLTWQEVKKALALIRTPHHA